MKHCLRSSAYGHFGFLSGYVTKWVQQRLQDTHKIEPELRRMELTNRRSDILKTQVNNIGSKKELPN
ncbi:hypothetical protein YC2023_116183 [Brassica napus]